MAKILVSNATRRQGRLTAVAFAVGVEQPVLLGDELLDVVTRGSVFHPASVPGSHTGQCSVAMALFADADELYAHLGKLFQDAVADPELAPAFQRTDATIQYRLRGPDAQLTVRTVPGEEPQVDLGASTLTPDVVMAMDADVAHRFWLGKVNPTIALARGDIRARGPVAKDLMLVPLVKPVFPRYRAQLEAAGREDLANAV